jgi:NACHT domain
LTAYIELVKNIAPIATPFISSVVDVWIKPKLQERYIRNKLSNEIYRNNFEDNFKEYLKRAYDRNNIMNTIVFQNRPKSLSELYIPLTLQSSHGNTKDILIDKYEEAFISKYKKLVITDSAGMGKSTLLKYLFIDSVKTNVGVPIFIELRKLSKDNNVIDEIFKELNPIDDSFDKNFILSLIKRGDFIFFLDGYDEIPLDQRISVTEDLQSFISKASKNIFILSSRPQTAIASFSDFHEFKIKPLEKDEAFELLRKYDGKNNLAEQLIEVITKEINYKNLEEFLINPLMVSLLYKGYEYKQTISYKKSIFYRQVFDALYENHDLTKGGAFVHEKLSMLDIEEFHTVLRIVAYLTWKIGKVEYDKDEIIKYLSKAREYTNIEFKESRFLDDLVANVPLFYEEGNLYRWKHKSLQEYFSAQYICTDSKDLQEVILNNIYSSKDFVDYLNVLDLCYDIDYKTFRKTIIYNFTCDVLEYNAKSYKYFDGIDSKSIKNRKQLLFGKKFFIVTNTDLCKEYKDVKKGSDIFMSASINGEEFIYKNYKEEVDGYEIKGGEKHNGYNFIVICFEKLNSKIMELFVNKGEKFISPIPTTYNDEKDNSSANKIFKPKKELQCQIIKDNPELVYNQPNNFELVNEIILNTHFQHYKLNFDKLRELKKEIEIEKETFKKDDLSIF